MSHATTTLAPIITAHEEPRTFADDLYDWMGRAPFLAIAFVLHLVAFVILSAIPWSTRDDEPRLVISAVMPPPPDVFEEPEEPIEPEIPEPTDEEPVDFEDVVVDPQEFESQDDVKEDTPESLFESDQWNDAIGTNGGASSGAGNAGRRGRVAGGGAASFENVLSGLEWLKDHQADDGRWDCDGFMHDSRREGPLQDGAGDPAHDVGVTGLALLAFMGIGDTMRDGEYAPQIRLGVGWLLAQQDVDSGRIGASASHAHLYDHSIATLALCEALYGDPGHPLLKRAAQRAVNYISAARNPYGAWRYAVPPNGDQDTSVTGWMVFALAAAREAGLSVSDDDLLGALAWIEEMTDPVTGRTGYTQTGGDSSRPEHLLDSHPASESEAMTAVGMLSRLFVKKALSTRVERVDGLDEDTLAKGATILLESQPTWSDDGSTNDMYAWYYGSYAMHQYGSRDERAWKAWKRSMEAAILPNQRDDAPTFDGSWDPNGPWGQSGGRVYSTATMVLCLEVYYRYGNLMGTR